MYQHEAYNVHGDVDRKQIHPENNFVQNFNYLFNLSRVSGLNGFKLPTNRDDSVRLTMRSVLFSLTLAVQMTINSSFNVKKNIQFDFSESIIVNFGFAMTMWMEAVHCSFLIVSDILNRKKIWKIVTEFYEFDQQVNIWISIANGVVKHDTSGFLFCQF